MRILAAALMVCGTAAAVGGFALIRWEAALICVGVLAIGAAADLSQSLRRRD